MRPITIETIRLHNIAIPFVEPLKTSFGEEPFKTAVIAELVTTDGVIGWGEASVELEPGYGPETMVTAYHVMAEFLAHRLEGQTLNHPTETPDLLAGVRGNNHAKAGVEMALWDAFARTNEMRLTDLFAAYLPAGHASRGYATVGVSIGIKPTVEDTLTIINKRLSEGYQRIKLKIEPGWDIELARGVREALPDITLMLDANSAYSLADIDHLKQLDQFNLLMIEQPLGHEDIYEHGKLKGQLKTPVCLDESIKSAHDLQIAMALNAISILNLKPARVGGFTESLKIYRLCVEHQLPLWIGGMMETGVGRAANTAFASLPGVTLPCDISATNRYFDPDITEPPFVLDAGSRIAVPDGIGSGVEMMRDRLQEASEYWQANYPYKAEL